MKRPHFGGISIFLRFGTLWGPRHLCFFRDPTTAKIPKNRVWGPVEAVSAKFSSDVKFAHGDSATDEPKKIQILSRWARFMLKIPVRAHAGGRAYGGAGAKGFRKKTLKFDRKSPKTKKIELTIKMCGISWEIAWQLFFSLLDPFWPTFGHFTGSGRNGLYRGASPKRLSKNLKFDRKSPKVNKIELTIKMCGTSSGIPWQHFFSILDLFWPTFGHFTSSGQ